MSDARPVLLVVRALGLGDLLAGVPAYRALARHYRDHRRILATPRALHALLETMPGVFDDAIDARALAPLEVSGEVDIAVNLHGSGPQSHRVVLATRPTRMLAFAHDEIAQSSDGPAWNAQERETVRWCRLLAHYGIAASPDDLDLAPPTCAIPSRFRGATIIHPGAASGARRWPLERWIAVARACREAGERVLLTGSPAESELTQTIALRAGIAPSRNLAGKTSVAQLAGIVAFARHVVCGDTGVAHLATAYRIPSTLLFGPTPPALWGPPPERTMHRVLWCGTRGDPHGAMPDRGLLAISSDDVIDAMFASSGNS